MSGRLSMPVGRISVMVDANGEVQEVLESLVAKGPEVGLQVAAYLDGRLVVDAWAGLADAETGRRVDGATLFTAFSMSKGIVATCVHILADRGLLDYDESVAAYWPEFGVKGKAKATVRDALAHGLGIPQDPPGFHVAMATDWDSVCELVAEMEPLWEPGSRTVYHPFTSGWVLGEVVRRMDGRGLGQFVQDEICTPLAITGLYFGVRPEEEGRLATLTDLPGLEPMRSALNPSLADMTPAFNRAEIRQACFPGAGALANARSLARHYAMLAGGGELDGVRLLSAERARILAAPEYEESQHGQDSPWFQRHGLGYTLGGGPGPRADHPGAFGYEGLGTIAFADPERRFAFAITKNLLDWSATEMDTATLLVRVVEEALGMR
jgi:CubicO group peptidase (beta-lactamase class C family)